MDGRAPRAKGRTNLERPRLPESFLRPPAFGGDTTLQSNPRQPPGGNLCASGNGKWMMKREPFSSLDSTQTSPPSR